MNQSLVEKWKQRVIGIPGFAVFAFVVSFTYFGPFLENFFTADDLFCLQDFLHGPGRVLLGYDNNLRVVSNFFWLPLHAISGLQPFGYNLFCIILYAINAILLYCLMDRLFANRKLALVSAIIFITGGIGADAVFWRAASATLINMCWYLLALHAYVLFRRLDQRKYRYLSLLLFLLAMFSKEEAASLPCMILLLELLFNGEPVRLKKLASLILPYVLIIAFYLLANHLVIHHILDTRSFLAGILKIRPLYSLFGGFSAFFISPTGYLAPGDPRIYLTAVLIPASFFLVREKKLLLFGYLWIFFAFLPQSLSSQSQFQGDMLATSISRHLYLPSVGSSLVLATLLLGLAGRLARLQNAACLLFLAFHISFHYSLVHERGRQWQAEGAYVQRFVQEMQNLLPTIPVNSYVTVTAPPVGRAFTLAALRAFYHNPKIFWKDNIQELQQQLPPGATGIFIDFAWEANWYYGRPARAFFIEPLNQQRREYE